jgi:hypothetical protein
LWDRLGYEESIEERALKNSYKTDGEVEYGYMLKEDVIWLQIKG